jgi:hypothetical protein
MLAYFEVCLVRHSLVISLVGQVQLLTLVGTYKIALTPLSYSHQNLSPWTGTTLIVAG